MNKQNIINQMKRAEHELELLSAMLTTVRHDKSKEAHGAAKMLREWQREILKEDI